MGRKVGEKEKFSFGAILGSKSRLFCEQTQLILLINVTYVQLQCNLSCVTT